MAKGRQKGAPRSSKVNAVIVFSDIRGFSEWSSTIEAHERTFQLISAYQALLKSEFKAFAAKPLGDGAMLVRDIDITNIGDADNALTEIITSINSVESKFENLKGEVAIKSGSRVALALGWGITRGTVVKVASGPSVDYLGHNVNEAARLCDIARPYGVVIDRADFPHAPSTYRVWFRPQTRRLSKMGQEVEVWVSRDIYEEFQAREVLKETPEVHVAGVCVRPYNGSYKVLLAQRSAERSLFPLKWEGCGGQLRNSESFQEGVERHFRTEMRLAVKVISEIKPELYGIEGPTHIPGLRFICRYVSGEASSANHKQIAWRTIEELRAMPEEDFPPGFQAQALALISRLG